VPGKVPGICAVPRAGGRQVGWPARPLRKVEAALAGSYLVCGLLLRVRRPDGSLAASEQLVGCARATSDRAFNATIWDVSPWASLTMLCSELPAVCDPLAL
jgi:hypothetical protein